jgi:hypothetical protein
MAEQMGLLANIGQGLQRKFGRIGDALSGRDENARDRLALGLMSLGNSQQTQTMQQLVANRLEERKKQAQANKSIEYLKTIDPRLAALAENNPSMVGSIFSEIAKRQLNPQQARIETGRDNFKYYITGPNAGQRVLPGQLTEEDEAIMNLQSRLGVDSQTAANMYYQQKGFTLPGANNQTVAFLEEKAAAGDENAKAALLLVGPKGAGEAMKTYINAASTNAANKTAANTKTYLNGLSISVFQDGTKQVVSPDNQILTGPAATEAIKIAQANEVEQARLTEFETKSAGAKAKMVQTTISNLINVDSSLRNMARAKRALRDSIASGQADISGPINQYFPDISVEAAELTSARNALGLDVVGSVTFGALSKGELDLALTQGLPLGLKPPQLLEFIERREAAIKKYRTILMQAARTMADPQKDYDDYLDTLEDLEGKPNPYKTKSDDDLEQLYIEVMSGTSNLSVKNRQFIVDEADRRAQL